MKLLNEAAPVEWMVPILPAAMIDNALPSRWLPEHDADSEKVTHSLQRPINELDFVHANPAFATALLNAASNIHFQNAQAKKLEFPKNSSVPDDHNLLISSPPTDKLSGFIKVLQGTFIAFILAALESATGIRETTATPGFTDVSMRDLDTIKAELADLLAKKLHEPVETVAARVDRYISKELGQFPQDETLDRLIRRYNQMLITIDLPEGGFINKEQAQAAARLSSTYLNLVKRARENGVETPGKDDRVAKAEKLKAAYYRANPVHRSRKPASPAKRPIGSAAPKARRPSASR